MRQEEQASRGTPLKSTEQMRSTKVSLLKIEVAIDLNISNFSTACFSQANSCWSFLPPPKSWSWLIILYTTWSAHISRDNFGNVITLNQTMLATLHQSLGPLIWANPIGFLLIKTMKFMISMFLQSLYFQSFVMEREKRIFVHSTIWMWFFDGAIPIIFSDNCQEPWEMIFHKTP